MSQLNDIFGKRFNLDETLQFFKVLTKDKYTDSIFLSYNLIKTQCKQILGANTPAEFSKVVEIFEILHKTNPYAFH
jgi:hypothetical protein